jgi:hypothetical protein
LSYFTQYIGQKCLNLLNLQYYLKIQIDFFEPIFISAVRQKLFNRGQFGLAPVKNIFYPLSFGHKIPSDSPFLS